MTQVASFDDADRFLKLARTFLLQAPRRNTIILSGRRPVARHVRSWGAVLRHGWGQRRDRSGHANAAVSAVSRCVGHPSANSVTRKQSRAAMGSARTFLQRPLTSAKCANANEVAHPAILREIQPKVRQTASMTHCELVQAPFAFLTRTTLIDWISRKDECHLAGLVRDPMGNRMRQDRFEQTPIPLP